MSTRPRVLAELGEELDQAARRTLKPGRLRRPSPSALLPGVGVALALAIAVVAIVALGHRRKQASAPVVPAAARQLVSELAVLRRPQSAADRTLPTRAGPSHLVPSLTRLVATTDLGTRGAARTYLVVAPPQPGCYLPAPEGGDQAILVTVFAARTSSYGLGFSAVDLRRFAVAPTPMPGLLTSVVPDGVTRVDWSVRGRHPVSPQIHNNAAVISGSLHPGSATWHFADGHTLTSKQEASSIPTCRPPLVVPGGANRVPAWLEQHFAIFRTGRLTHPLQISRLEYDESFAWHHAKLNFAQARLVTAGTGLLGSKPWVWIVPGTSGVCLLDGLGNGSCTSENGDRFRGDASPDSGGFRISSATPGYKTNMYTGLVPDGNQTVQIILANGDPALVPVTDNVYSVTVKGRARALIAKDAAGRTHRFTLYANDNQF